ncbi:hypothetical protein AYO46_04645 [Betaproteobacteria bacterium SCGC AG-212-J23]|nr:hypothetical protein AYO46_04645 [Betaproteobacteria bacterium SCGC AG-212-J23]
MHLKLDEEIVQVETRIAGRKHRLTQAGKATGKRALDTLASPVTLAGALALGFAAGGGLAHKRRNGGHHERRKPATAGKSGIAGLLVSGAMWFVRSQYGGPAGLARVLAAKFSKKGS